MNWEEVVATTIQEHARKVENNTTRDNKFLAKLKAKNRITYGHSGAGEDNDDMTWRVRYAQAALSGLDDSDTITYERLRRHFVAALPWRGYISQEQIGEKEKEQNKGNAAIIKYATNLGTQLIEDASEQFHDEFWIDGNAVGNGKRFHGIESFMAVAPGTLVTDKYATPDDEYAGHSTRPGAKGGSWSGSFPEGHGDTEYDCWSPKHLNWSSNAWGTNSTDFADNANVALRRALLHTRAANGKKGQVDTVFMERELLGLFLDLNETKERIQVQRGQSSDSLIALGFNDVVNYEGVDVTTEFTIPANTVYGINFDMIELCLLNSQKQLFQTKGPQFDMKSFAHLIAVYTFGNLKFNPRAFFKMYNYAAA